MEEAAVGGRRKEKKRKRFIIKGTEMGREADQSHDETKIKKDSANNKGGDLRN